MFIYWFEEGYSIVWYVKGLVCLVFKVIPQSSEIDGLFLNDMESLCSVLAVMTELAICSEMLWVCAQDCLAERTSSAGSLFPAHAVLCSRPDCLQDSLRMILHSTFTHVSKVSCSCFQQD